MIKKITINVNGPNVGRLLSTHSYREQTAVHAFESLSLYFGEQRCFESNTPNVTLIELTRVGISIVSKNKALHRILKLQTRTP